MASASFGTFAITDGQTGSTSGPPVFVDAFARYAAEAACLVVAQTGQSPFFCLINEISYWAWAGGEVGRFAPASTGRGAALKRQLVQATIAATDAVRRVAPDARFLHAEPLIHVAPASPAESDIYAAEGYRVLQFEALDMLAGRIAPELGGRPDYIDLVGVNFYPDNQWYLGGSTIPLGHHAYRPLRDMLAEVHARFGRPLILAETGAEGTARPSWLHYIGSEVAAARRTGVSRPGDLPLPDRRLPGLARRSAVCGRAVFPRERVGSKGNGSGLFRRASTLAGAVRRHRATGGFSRVT